MRSFTKTDHVVERNVRDEHILVPLSSGPARVDCLYTLNETAAFIWRQASEGRPEDLIAGRVAATFDVDAGTARDDTRRILDELVAIGALKLTCDSLA
jgi:hypothetical protein